MRLFLAILFFSTLSLSVLWAQSSDLKRVVKDAQKDEMATYEVESLSPFEKNKVLMEMKVISVGITRLKVKKTLKWKGRNFVRTSEFSLTRDFVEQLEIEIKNSWDSAQVDKKVESTPSTLSLDDDIDVTTLTIKQSGGTTTRKTTTSTRRSFPCYKITFTVKGTYPKKIQKQDHEEHPKPATMTMTYWISPKVPVFGLVKAEGTIVQTIQGVEVKSTIKISLKKYFEVK